MMDALLVADRGKPFNALVAQAASLEQAADDDIEALQQKEDAWCRMRESPGYRKAKFIADTWCAAFFWPKVGGDLEHGAPTEDLWRVIQEKSDAAPESTREEVEQLAERHAFLHWHLAFPHVFVLPPPGARPDEESSGWSGGFDVVLGNPPWETLSPDVKEFFAAYDPEVRRLGQDGQSGIVERLLQDRTIADRWTSHRRDLYTLVRFLKDSGRFRLFAPGNLGKGDFNVYRMFVELALTSIRVHGRASQLAPEGLYNGPNCMAIRREMIENCRLTRILGFVNSREVWFKGVHAQTRFAIYSVERGGSTTSIPLAFNLRGTDDLQDAIRRGLLQVPTLLVREFSPDALAIMEFSSQRGVDIAKKMYARWPKFGDEKAGPPIREYMAEVHMGNDRDLFSEDPKGVPLCQGSMVDQYDHRAMGYRGGRGISAEWEELSFGASEKSIQPQWRIPNDRIPSKVRERMMRYRIGFRDAANPKNERTFFSTIIPPGAICGHTVPTILFDCEFEWTYLPWLAVANSFTMDWLLRQKVGLHASYIVLDSLPFPRLSLEDPSVPALAPLVLRLTCTGPEMIPFWNAMAQQGWVERVSEDGQPPGTVDSEERLRLRAQIDAIVARDLYGLTAEEVDYILESFPIVKKRDIEKYGEYKTKLLVLAAHEESATHMDADPSGSNTPA